MANSTSPKTGSTLAVSALHGPRRLEGAEGVTCSGSRSPQFYAPQSINVHADVPAHDGAAAENFERAVAAGVARDSDHNVSDRPSYRDGDMTLDTKAVCSSLGFTGDNVEINNNNDSDRSKIGDSVVPRQGKLIRVQDTKLPRSWIFVLTLITVLVTVNGQEKRCICSLRGTTELFTYSPPFPPYHTHNHCVSYVPREAGSALPRCHITVDLAMTAEKSESTRPSGIRFLVTQDGYTSGGVIDHRGVTPIDRNLRSGPPLVLPERTSVNGVNILAYQDEIESYKLVLAECKVTLHYKSGDYLGVYSHDYSSSYLYNPRDLCGDCDGTRNEMTMKLPPDMIGQVRSLKERDAAMLYMASAHISGGPQKCFDYRGLISQCRKGTVLWALQVCGELFNQKNSLVTCLSGRADTGQVLDTYYHCVQQFCQGNARRGCRYIYDLASTMFCSVPMRMGC
ncbi:hypothetical protein EGW08_009860 [Elysia chlorotica]|uniref:Uncharacterized protein n=1 Tax=Elysia chlorotica TaxID=188477 RepID=A0A3S1HMF8_ELYCH|nr:hypothetical protein EGW08_009860 [Elysia chlorotica]